MANENQNVKRTSSEFYSLDSYMLSTQLSGWTAQQLMHCL